MELRRTVTIVRRSQSAYPGVVVAERRAGDLAMFGSGVVVLTYTGDRGVYVWTWHNTDRRRLGRAFKVFVSAGRLCGFRAPVKQVLEVLQKGFKREVCDLRRRRPIYVLD